MTNQKPTCYYDDRIAADYYEVAETTSTNVAVKELGQDSKSSVTWLQAGRQTEGKGRRARPWVSEKGNLYTSVFLKNPAPPETAAGLSFVAAIALRDAILACDETASLSDKLRYKWPNDLLLDGNKVAGILLEAHGRTDKQLNVVIGLGVNCAHNPDIKNYAVSHLNIFGAGITPQKLFSHLRLSFAKIYGLWDKGYNFEEIRTLWLEHAAGRGAPITVRLESRTFEGLFETLDENGYLVVRKSDGTKENISAGDVFFNTAPQTS